MASFNNYIRQRVNKSLAKIDLLKESNWILDRITVQLEFVVIEYDENGDAFIKTGTREKPDGISLLGDIFVMFVDKERSYNYFYIHVLDLKNYIKHNYSELKDRMSMDKKRYSIIGFNVNIKEIKEYLNKNDAYYGTI